MTNAAGEEFDCRAVVDDRTNDEVGVVVPRRIAAVSRINDVLGDDVAWRPAPADLANDLVGVVVACAGFPPCLDVVERGDDVAMAAALPAERKIAATIVEFANRLFAVALISESTGDVVDV